MGIAGRVFGAALLVWGLPVLADPPQLVTGSAGPQVQGFALELDTKVTESVRGLETPVAEVDFIQPGFVPVPVDVTTCPDPNASTGGCLFFMTGFGYSLDRTEEVTETAVNGGYSFDVRVGLNGAILATGTGATADEARATALASPALDSIRALIVATQEVVLAATVTVVVTLTSVMTGYDEFISEGELTFGQINDQARPLVGFLGECATPFSDCARGQELVLGLNDASIVVYTLRDIFITDTIARTITTVRNSLLTLTLDPDAEVPPITVGPVVQTRDGPKGSTLIVSERGLNIPFEGLADVAVQYILDGETFDLGPNYEDTDSGTSIVESDEEGQLILATAFGYTVSTRTVTASEAADGGFRVQARLGQAGPTIASAMGATLDQAVAAVLALPQVLAVAFEATEVVANGISQTVVQRNGQAITGRDTYVSEGAIFFGPDRVLIGNLGRCTTTVTACEGGLEAVFGDTDTLSLVYTIQDLYVTQTITDVVTTVQEYFLNLILAGGDGASHAGAQAVGFEAGERFLAFMGREAAVRQDAAQVSRGVAGRKPLRFFAEAAGGSGEFGRIGGIESSGWSASGLAAGVAVDAGNGWTLGAAVETGRWDWTGDGNRSEGDSRKFGLFAGWRDGPWTLGAEVFSGQTGVETRDALGVTADYDVDLQGFGLAAAYAIPAGQWTITPQAALRWVVWDAPAVTDSAGGLVEAARVEQLRPEVGVTASRRIALDRGALDLGFEARAWTVTGDRTGMIAAGILTEGPDLGSGGSLGVRADWQMAPGAVVSGAVNARFGDGAPDTFASVGLRMAF